MCLRTLIGVCVVDVASCTVDHLAPDVMLASTDVLVVTLTIKLTLS